ncbi:MAG TPA: TonB-dependent receptor [Steroidobacteraceae bacterium]|nr:TonB-dependent receptor [Steroidobacteraceae bacterium]HNS27105.1 TonB-dependent receptor [Steroidobacteraceae bacterium]
MLRRNFLGGKQLIGTTTMAALLALPLCAAAQEGETFEIQEVVVTAQKRTERLVDVPVAISVFSAEAIDQTGVRELKEVTGYMPNVQISSGNDFRSTVTIRGVGATSRNIGFDSRVGVYIDGVYVGQSPAINQELMNLERVEVLRGPQGTLFGKNTVAGAINLVTKKPDDELRGMASVDIGNYDYREIRAFANLPLGEAVSTSFSVSKTDRDGYVPNIVTGNDLNERDVLAYRAQLRFSPNERFEANASFDGLNSDGRILIGDPVTDMLGMQPVQIAPKMGEVGFNFDPNDERDVYGGSLDLAYELANGHTLKSITGYRTTDAVYSNATDYSPVDIVSIAYRDEYDVLSQELQFISATDKAFSYTAGLYFYHQKANTSRDVILGNDFETYFIGPLYASGALTPPLPAPPALPNNVVRQLLGFGPPLSKVYNSGEVTTESYAAYFNGDWHMTDRWKLGFGVRISTEKKDVDWLLDGRNSGIFNIGSTGPDPLNPTPMINDRTDDFVAPAASLSYALTPRSNVYARYAAGYKSGGFNLDYINEDELAANQGLEFDKETVDSFELGIKGNYFNGRLSMNLAAFIANYDDYQVNQFVDLGGGRTSIRINNAAKVETTGFEAEATLYATDELTLHGSLGLLQAEFDSFPGGGSGGTDVSGNELTNAPDLTYSFSAVWKHPVPALRANLLMRGDVTHISEVYTTADNTTTTPYNSAYPGVISFGQLEARTELNARIGLMSDNETWEVYAWGRNLTDETDPTDELRDFFGTIAKLPGMPRTYGVNLVWNFH